MGATFLVKILPGDKSRTEIERAFQNLVDDAREEQGTHSYSGSWKEMNGLRFLQANGRSLSQVKEDCLDLDKGDAVAIRTTDDRVDREALPSHLTALRDKAGRCAKAVEEHIDGVLTRLTAAKSLTKGCICGSAIAVRYLRRTSSGQTASINCPVCNAVDFPLSTTDLARKATLLSKLDAAKADFETQLAALKKAQTKEIWAIFGWARS